METTSHSMAKIITSNELVPVQVPVKNLTDLGIDCLLIVFDYLKVIDLANLVQANIVKGLGKRNRKKLRYQQSIVKAFKIKVKMHKWKTCVGCDHRSAAEDIRMLRSFGRYIESLLLNGRVSYTTYNGNTFVDHQNRRYERALEDAIIGNCSKTLTGISFESCNKDTMKELDRSFKVVESVQFYSCHLGRTLGQLKRWFPKLVDLHFTETYVSDPQCIHEHFPDVRSLMVWNNSRQGVEKGKMNFSNSNLEVFSQMNPQLETLNIRHDDVDESDGDDSEDIIVNWNLLTMISKNWKLKKLKLNLEDYRFEREWPSTVAVDSLIELNVECSNSHFLQTIRMTSAHLNEMKLKICYPSTDMKIDYEAITTFVVRVAPIQLKIIAEGQTFAMDNVQVIQMVRMLPHLQELSIECEWDDNIPDAVMNLLVNATGSALKKLTGICVFDGDSEGGPGSEYLQMRPVFRHKIVRNDSVARNWSYRFDYRDDCDYYVDTIKFILR